MDADGGDQFAGKRDVIGLFEQDGYTLAEPEDQARGDGLFTIDGFTPRLRMDVA